MKTKYNFIEFEFLGTANVWTIKKMNFVKTKLTALAIVATLGCLLYGFLPTQAQVGGKPDPFYCEYINTDSVTVNIIIVNHPKTENQFKEFLDEIGDNIKLRDWDDLKFWLYISVVNDVLGELPVKTADNYKDAADEFLQTANYWLNKHYVEKKRGKNSI